MENLIEISKNKSEILNEVYFLTVEQSRVIAKEDIEGLNDLIDKKQVLIDRAKNLDTEFEKIVDELKLVYDVEKLEEIKKITGEGNVGLCNRGKGFRVKVRR